MTRKLNIVAIVICVALLLGLSVVPIAANGLVLPKGFRTELLADGLDQPKGIVSALHRAGAGPFGHDLYVAEAGQANIVAVDKNGAGASHFASVAEFPVGVAFHGGPFGKYLYVGEAYGGGIVRVDQDGNVTPFALPGMEIAGLDFGRGAYGDDLYAGKWSSNPMNPAQIWRVDPSGNAILFYTAPPGVEVRYLKFSHGGAFGTLLYFTDIVSGNVYQVDPSGQGTVFASTGGPWGLEGLDFSPGGAFGHYLYAGNLSTGDIYQVAPDGTVGIWASGFGGVADIRFEPGKRGGFTMYIVNGQGGPIGGPYQGKVYAIEKAK